MNSEPGILLDNVTCKCPPSFVRPGQDRREKPKAVFENIRPHLDMHIALQTGAAPLGSVRLRRSISQLVFSFSEKEIVR